MIVYDHKVPGGKLIRVKMVITDRKIESIQILGDFFLHPEEAITSIECGLVGTVVSSAALTQSITEVLENTAAELIGATASDIAEAILLGSKTSQSEEASA